MLLCTCLPYGPVGLWPVTVLNVFVETKVCYMVIVHMMYDFERHGARYCLLFLVSYLNCCGINNKE
jgi:hypothetical protein